MIVMAWFVVMGLIILGSFAFLIATFIHWGKEARRRREMRERESASS